MSHKKARLQFPVSSLSSNLSHSWFVLPSWIPCLCSGKLLYYSSVWQDLSILSTCGAPCHSYQEHSWAMFLLLFLEWCCITIPVVLLFPLTRNRSQALLWLHCLRYAATSEGISHLYSQSGHLGTYPASQLYSAKFNLRLIRCLNFDL